MTFATMTSAMGAHSDRAAQMRAKLEERFAKADTNGDGKLTKEEARAGMPRVYSNFDSIDADQVGYVTLEQIERFIAAKAGNRQDSAKE
ncbi:MAG TPA: EF-hand domain-containing protein [Steroidobacteraceae bacterium]|nr:EF-hand domain-containing protein [Steroidobacteraceae bacterium]